MAWANWRLGELRFGHQGFPAAEKSLVYSTTRRITGSARELSGHDQDPKFRDWEPGPVPSPTKSVMEAIATASN